MNRRSFLRGLMASAAVTVAPAVPGAARGDWLRWEDPTLREVWYTSAPSVIQMHATQAADMGLPAMWWDVNTDQVLVLEAELRAWIDGELMSNKWITQETVDMIFGPTGSEGGLAEILANAKPLSELLDGRS